MELLETRQLLNGDNVAEATVTINTPLDGAEPINPDITESNDNKFKALFDPLMEDEALTTGDKMQVQAVKGGMEYIAGNANMTSHSLATLLFNTGEGIEHIGEGLRKMGFQLTALGINNTALNGTAIMLGLGIGKFGHLLERIGHSVEHAIDIIDPEARAEAHKNDKKPEASSETEEAPLEEVSNESQVDESDGHS